MNEEIEKLIFRAIDGAISPGEFNRLQDVLEVDERREGVLFPDAVPRPVGIRNCRIIGR